MRPRSSVATPARSSPSPVVAPTRPPEISTSSVTMHFPLLCLTTVCPSAGPSRCDSPHHLPLALHDEAGAHQQVLGADLRLDPERISVERALPQAREVDHGFAQGLARDRAAVDRHSTQLVAFHDGNLLSQLGGLDGRTLPRGAAADDHHVEILHAPPRVSRSASVPRWDTGLP